MNQDINAIEQFKTEGLLCDLSPTENKEYREFLDWALADKIQSAEAALQKKPEDSIALNFYAMQDVLKLFLLKKYTVKITVKEVKGTIKQLIKEIVCDENILKLFEKGEETYMPIVMRQFEKFKANYNSKEPKKELPQEPVTEADINNAILFRDNIVKPYIQLFDRIMPK